MFVRGQNLLYMYDIEYYGWFSYETWEFFMLPIWLIVIYFISRFMVVRRNLFDKPYYKYYIPGLFVKLVGAVSVCMIYTIYYTNGGDTTSYFECSSTICNLLIKHPLNGLHVLFGEANMENIFLFDSETGYPYRFMYLDTQTFTLIRILTPFVFLGSKSFLITAVLLAWASYLGIWKLYELFVLYYPMLSKQFAISILFVPSVFFWGSGILKDTVTLSASCWFVYGLHKFLIEKRITLRYFIIIFLSAVVVVFIKPYIFITLLPGSIMWVLLQRLMNSPNRRLVVIYLPIIYGLSLIVGLFILSRLGNVMSKFSLDQIVSTAVVTQKDLKQGYYGSNSFDLGEFDGSFGSFLSKAPLAMNAGLFRPYIWESRNPVMALSGLENLCILGLTILILVRIKIRRIFSLLINNPLLFFSVSYSLFFSFAVGLTTSNFGALVRFKIPFLPFYVSSLFILAYFINKEKLLRIMEQKKNPFA
jgi:hypothetical protein